MVRSPTRRSAAQISMAYFPDASDASLQMPSFSAGAIVDASMQLFAVDEDDMSFQIPLAANNSNLLGLGEDTFLQGADTLNTPYLPKTYQEPLTLSDLTPQASPTRQRSVAASRINTPRRSETPKFKPSPRQTRAGSRSPAKPSSPLKRGRLAADDQNTPERPLKAVFSMPKDDDFRNSVLASPALVKLKADLESLAHSPPSANAAPTDTAVGVFVSSEHTF
jgi:hypothetical protein